MILACTLGRVEPGGAVRASAAGLWPLSIPITRKPNTTTPIITITNRYWGFIRIEPFPELPLLIVRTGRRNRPVCSPQAR